MPVSRRLGAELLGTFWLVLGGCGSAVVAAKVLEPGSAELGIGYLGVALAFGLTVLTGSYAFGHVSGGHFNPAVTLGLVASGRFPVRDAGPYVVVQVVGAILAAAVLWVVAIGAEGTSGGSLAASGFASNGFGAHSPGGYSLGAAFLAELVLTGVFLFVILGATDKRATAPLAGMTIGFCLTLIHLMSIPITNTSVNPARSTGPALLAALGGEGWPLGQLWLFWVAPILGGVLAGLAYPLILPGQEEPLAEGAPTA